MQLCGSCTNKHPKMWQRKLDVSWNRKRCLTETHKLLSIRKNFAWEKKDKCAEMLGHISPRIWHWLLDNLCIGPEVIRSNVDIILKTDAGKEMNRLFEYPESFKENASKKGIRT